MTQLPESTSPIQKILFLTEEIAFPPLGGGQIRDCFLIELLRENFEVEVLTFKNASKDPIPERVTVQVIDRGRSSLLKKVLFPFRPYIVNGFSPAMAQAIAQRKSPNTILWASRLTMGKYLKGGKQLGLKTILDEHNVESHLLLHYALKKPSAWIHLWNALWARYYENRFCCLADLVVATSEYDASLIKNLCSGIDVLVIPNCIDPTNYRSEQNLNPEIDFLFIGTLNYGPNIEGLTWFMSKVLPRLQQRMAPRPPKIVFAGSHPDRKLLQLAKQQGIQVLENPSEMVPIISSAKVIFVPLLFGSGTRIKILEAMASKKTVISTPKGAEGLDLVHTKGIWIASTEAEFAEGMGKLIEEADLRKKIESEAVKIVASQYDWRKMRPRVAQMINHFGPKT